MLWTFPGGFGKVPISSIRKTHDGKNWLLTDFEGRQHIYQRGTKMNALGICNGTGLSDTPRHVIRISNNFLSSLACLQRKS